MENFNDNFNGLSLNHINAALGRMVDPSLMKAIQKHIRDHILKK